MAAGMFLLPYEQPLLSSNLPKAVSQSSQQVDIFKRYMSKFYDRKETVSRRCLGKILRLLQLKTEELSIWTDSRVLEIWAI